MPASVDKNMFASMYSGQPPWDIGRPQPAFTKVADQIAGAVLDAGCGTGEHSLYFAGKGCKVTGIDFLEEPIQRANRKAAERGLSVTFLVKDATDLKNWAERFYNVIDSGLFHGFSDEDRTKYVEGLATVLKLGGRLFLMCFRIRGGTTSAFAVERISIRSFSKPNGMNSVLRNREVIFWWLLRISQLNDWLPKKAGGMV